MKIGKVRVANQLIAEVFQFPVDWKIEKIYPFDRGDLFSGISIMEISGSDFPEVSEGATPELVDLVCHRKETTYTVKKIK